MDYKDLQAYKIAFELAMNIFESSKSFPKEEVYSLSNQIRRSSRSVCANFAEAYRKRNYPANFTRKLIECDAENAETQVWLDFALTCKYLTPEKYEDLLNQSISVGKLISFMLNNPEKFGVKIKRN